MKTSIPATDTTTPDINRDSIVMSARSEVCFLNTAQSSKSVQNCFEHCTISNANATLHELLQCDQRSVSNTTTQPRSTPAISEHNIQSRSNHFTAIKQHNHNKETCSSKVMETETSTSIMVEAAKARPCPNTATNKSLDTESTSASKLPNTLPNSTYTNSVIQARHLQHPCNTQKTTISADAKSLANNDVLSSMSPALNLNRSKLASETSVSQQQLADEEEPKSKNHEEKASVTICSGISNSDSKESVSTSKLKSKPGAKVNLPSKMNLVKQTQKHQVAISGKKSPKKAIIKKSISNSLENNSVVERAFQNVIYTIKVTRENLMLSFSDPIRERNASIRAMAERLPRVQLEKIARAGQVPRVRRLSKIGLAASVYDVVQQNLLHRDGEETLKETSQKKCLNISTNTMQADDGFSQAFHNDNSGKHNPQNSFARNHTYTNGTPLLTSEYESNLSHAANWATSSFPTDVSLSTISQVFCPKVGVIVTVRKANEVFRGNKRTNETLHVSVAENAKRLAMSLRMLYDRP